MDKNQTAVFAGGCFWGVQSYFDDVPGVLKTEVGYTGGRTDNPTYEDVCSHTTGHAEAVLITFDQTQISYSTLLKHFFRMHDPTQLNRQGPDVGDSYRSAIFYADDWQQETAEAVKNELNQAQFEGKIVTEIIKAGKWWPAEDYHQKFAARTGRGACHIAFKPL